MIEPDFSKSNGLLPAIAQDYLTGEILMQAYMTRESWEETLKCGYAVYYSRSREELWKKGATSGNLQEIKEIILDCDLDSILLKINQMGGSACHTGKRSCFFNKVPLNK
ncbi:MAG: phosphoribosyl-AMP cyclohydrolase [Spirochaetaceae bacterium]|jgi:phosphoribosyl-AMP cyclohydrolase|nr:phosphoribosyl-AMP cyclohydrolase [Spirochaetaceae bacterium]